MDLDGADMFFGGLFILLAVVIVVAVVDIGFKYPVASQKALEICEEKGFDSYESYEKQIFSTTPLGVKCSHIQNKYEIEGQGVIAVK